MPATPPTTRSRSRRMLLWSVLPVGLFVVIAGLLGARAWVEGFLRSDDFRHFLERKTSAALRADAHLQPLRWQDTEVFTEALDATGNSGSPFAKLTVEQLRARFDLHALWRRTWRVDGIEVERFAATLGNAHPVAPDTAAAAEVQPSAPSDEGQGRGFLAGLLPSRVEVGAVTVKDFSLLWNTGRVAGTRLTARPRDGGTQNWDIDGSGGQLEEAHFPTVRLTDFNVKSSAHEVFITRATGQSDGGGRLDLSGRQGLDGDRALDLTADFDGLPVQPFLPADWRARLHGNATGNVHVTGSANGVHANGDGGDWHARGHIELHDGQLEALPLLDELAVFTATERFRQTALQRGRADFVWTPGGVTVSGLLVESEGLLRIEGGFTVRGDQMDGTFQVGVARGSLRWIAGLGARVFDQPERDGYMWTTTHLHGPVRHPSEDLTPRLVAAAQQEVIDKAKQGAGTVLDTASSLLDLLKGH